jgi:RES domain-containing protein
LIAVYRLCSARYSPNDGAGAAQYGGRWNSKGTPVIYASSNPSLATLEVIVHVAARIPVGYTLTEIGIPARVG